MKLSYSTISSYQKCPLSYKFQYIDKLPTKKSPDLSFGSSLHKALHFMYAVPTPNPPSLDEVLNALVEGWESDSYADEVDEQNRLDYACQVIEQFYAANAEHFCVPVAVEYRFSIEIEGVQIVGVIDRVDKLPSGGFEIIDYKTNKRLPSREQVERDLQLSIYHMAAEQIWGISPEKLSLYFLLPNLKMSATRSPEQLAQTREEILRVAQGISDGSFPATENPLCHWCNFKLYCPYFADQEIAKSVISKAESIDIRTIVDEFIETSESIKEANQRLDELKAEIHAYCETHKVFRVFGTIGHITRHERKVRAYDVDLLRQVLEAAGLWDKVLKLDSNAVDGLLSSPDVPEELKSQIGSAKRVERTTYSLRIGKESQVEERY